MAAWWARASRSESFSRSSPAGVASRQTRMSRSCIATSRFASAANTGPGGSVPAASVELPAQLGLQHLAVIVLRQRLDEAVAARPLEAGDVVEAEPVELGLAHRGAGPGDDESDDLLAPFGMRAADHRGLGEAGMAQQHLLDLARVDVAAARDDHVLRAVAQGQEAVRVHIAEVAGMQPAAAQRLGIGGRVLPIALHDAIALGHDLADLAGRQFMVIVVDDADQDAIARHAGRAE